jgi:hypothetical protein
MMVEAMSEEARLHNYEGLEDRKDEDVKELG